VNTVEGCILLLNGCERSVATGELLAPKGSPGQPISGSLPCAA